MRVLPFAFAFFPLPVWAADIPLVSDVTAVTLYPTGATITRDVPFSIPEGRHDLILTDLPKNTPLASVRVMVDGVAMGGVTARRDFVPPRNEDDTVALQAARDEVDRLEGAMRQAEGDVEVIRLEAEAARARVGFLEKLGEGDGVAQMDVTALRELSAMIGDETLSALRAAHEAERKAEEAARGLKDLAKELERARQALAALVPEQEDRAMLAIAVSSEVATDGMVTITYNTNEAAWQPVYDVKLTRETGALRIERGAYVAQYTGENWQGAALTLSTVRPTEQTGPSDIWPWLRHIFDPEETKTRPTVRMQAEADVVAGALSEMVMAEPEPVVAAADFDGLSVTYSYPAPVDVASGADRLRLSLGTLETRAELVAQAVPLSDQTAFLMASITNDMGELILPTAEASFYLDERFVGKSGLALIAAGDEADLSFGPIEGLRLTRTVLDRNEGDRGVIVTSNEITEMVRIDVENLTGETWPLRVLDRVPYSEQEDLEITWRATPRPSEESVDGKRGVLAWEMDITPGTTEVINLSHTIDWPEGMRLE
ncbi:MAG: DUF4139 domain-containing protein [Pseudomonadota bacterium]